jgi:hypothetical protein
MQQPGRGTLSGRVLRNQFWWQIEVKIGNEHGSNYRAREGFANITQKLWRSAKAYGTMRGAGNFALD